ncbi:MAG: hypothetical protein V2A34_05900 [Lentisphaerota bacterium]
MVKPSGAGANPVRYTLLAWPGSYVIRTCTNVFDAWLPETTQSVDASGAAQLSGFSPDRSCLFVSAEGLTPSDGRGCVAQFQTVGSSFAPEVRCDLVPPSEFRWYWSDGGTSTSYPLASNDFGSAGARTHGLLVDPSNAISSINLGFDGADGGDTTPLSHRPGQNVSQVLFPYPLTGLRYWASSYNPITNTLDFSGFAALEAIECFQCTSLQHVRATNLPSLTRACFEDCDLQELDLSGNPNLGDLRGAMNAYTRIITDRGTGPAIWHWCTRDNPQLTQAFQEIMTNFFSLRELFIWNDNQNGFFTCGSTSLTEVIAFNNHYSDGSVAGQTHLTRCEFQNNELTNFTLAGCPALQYVDLHGNQLATQALDAVLSELDASSLSLVQADLTQNQHTPSAAGLVHYSNLIARGASVVIDWPSGNDGFYEVAGGSDAITFVTTSRHPNMEIQTGSGTATNILWHWGDGTTVPGARLAGHDFGSAGVHTNYIRVMPPSSVSYFGAQQGVTGQGIASVYNASHFPSLNYLYLFEESVTVLSLAGCASLVQLHLANNPVSVAVCDQWFIDLNQAVTGSVTRADFYYPSSQRSSASDAAWSNLAAKGYNMHPL